MHILSNINDCTLLWFASSRVPINLLYMCLLDCSVIIHICDCSFNCFAALNWAYLIYNLFLYQLSQIRKNLTVYIVIKYVYTLCSGNLECMYTIDTDVKFYNLTYLFYYTAMMRVNRFRYITSDKSFCMLLAHLRAVINIFSKLYKEATAKMMLRYALKCSDFHEDKRTILLKLYGHI